MAETFSPLSWHEEGTKRYETGVSKGVLWVKNTDGTYADGVVWNGLREVESAPSGAEANDFWADNSKYLSLRGAEDYGCTIGAYSSPEEFDICDGTASPVKGLRIGQQTRRPFAFSWQNKVGNETDGDKFGYTIHIVYNATASPTNKTYTSTNDSPEPSELSWEVETVPVDVPGYDPTAHIWFNSFDFKTEDEKAKLLALEKMIYGSTEANSKCPTIEEIINLLGDTEPEG